MTSEQVDMAEQTFNSMELNGSTVTGDDWVSGGRRWVALDFC